MTSEQDARIVAALERGDAREARLDGLIERNTVAFEGMMAALGDVRTAIVDVRTAIVDVSTAIVDVRTAVLDFRAGLADLSEESRAQRGALIAILDRLENGGSSPA